MEIRIVDYNQYEFSVTTSFDENSNNSMIRWLQINGTTNNKELLQVLNAFQIDLNDNSIKPSFKQYKDYLYLNIPITSNAVHPEYINLIFNKNYIITITSSTYQSFRTMENRIYESNKIRCNTTDFLVYCLLDLILNEQFVSLEKVSTRIAKLDELLMSDSNISSGNFLTIKKEISSFKSIWRPIREIINNIIKSDFVSTDNITYFKDLQDHANQILDIIDSLYDEIANLYSLKDSIENKRLNDTMKILTIVSTIFAPLSFLAGVYGMNFSMMPLVNYKYGFAILITIMLVVVSGLLLFFKRKKWF